MIKISVGIETKKRPVENYLEVTLANLRRAGVFDSPHLAGTITTVDGHHVTRQQNAARAIHAAVLNAEQFGADWVMKLEDDLDVTDQFLENVAGWLADYGHANTPMFSLAASFEQVSRSLFNNNEQHIFMNDVSMDPDVKGIRSPSFPHVREYMRRGEACAPHAVRGFWGAQALVFRLADAKQLVEWLGPDPALFDGKEYHRQRGHDLLLQQWGIERGAKVFAVAVPSFVQHIGRRSNLDQPEINHVQPFFQFPFAGRDFRYQRRKR